MTPLRRARTTMIAALLAPVLLLSGCGSSAKDEPSAEPSTDLPKGNVVVPAGITLTSAGTSLALGESALVAYEPNTTRNSVLSLTVDSVQMGRLSEFSGYQLDDRTRSSRPYYARFTVKNVGQGDLGNMDVPLYAVSSSDALVQPSTFNNDFEPCPSKRLPAEFGAGRSFRGCLVYMVPGKGSLVEMSYRPLQAFEPITWKGTILPAARDKAAEAKQAAQKKAAQKKASKKKASS